MNPVVVRRSAVRMWLIAVLAVPFVLYGADLLLERRFVTSVLNLIHPDGELPAVETRDLAWAWTFVLVGGGIALWALKELVLPRKLIEADEDRLTLRMGGPLAKPARIPWSSIKELAASRAADDGDVFPVLVIEFWPESLPDDLPAAPWGARWVEPTSLAMSAREWDKPVTRVVELLRGLIGLARARFPAPAVESLANPESIEPIELALFEQPSESPAASEPEPELRQHWSDVAAEPDTDRAHEPRSLLDLPRSRFSGSHWIIIEDDEAP